MVGADKRVKERKTGEEKEVHGSWVDSVDNDYTDGTVHPLTPDSSQRTLHRLLEQALVLRCNRMLITQGDLSCCHFFMGRGKVH